MNLQDLVNDWRNDRDVNKSVNDKFTALVEADPELNAHREWVQSNIFGFGEKSFHWLHKIVVDEMPARFKFLEIGGFRMQVVSLYQLLANRTNRKIERFVVSPMSGMDGHWESDYFADSKRIHEQFGLNDGYVLYHGSSTEPNIIEQARESAQYDGVYIDGGHTQPVIESDLRNYVDMVKPGGLLIVDDCSNNLQMWPGAFPGIWPVAQAVDAYMPTRPEFVHLGAVMHNRIWKRI